MKQKHSLLERVSSVYSDAKEIISLFSADYSADLALTPAEIEASYKVRHKVYCAELHYESSNESEKESDEFDERATQLILYYKRLKTHIGCTRFVQGEHNGIQKPLPFETLCAGKLDERLVAAVKASGEGYVEVSRLAIDRQFRHKGKKGGLKSPVRSSCALIALLAGVHAYSRVENKRYLFAIVEERLMKCFDKLNMNVKVIGAPIEHRGTRYPILLDRKEMDVSFGPLFRVLCNLALKNAQRRMKQNNISRGENVKPLPVFGKRFNFTPGNLPDLGFEKQFVTSFSGT